MDPDDHRHCNFCGQKLPTNALVCFRCGSRPPFPPYPLMFGSIASPHDLNGPDVEQCEIGWVRRASGWTGRLIFQAQLIGSDDTYIVAEAEPISDKMQPISPGSGTFIPSPTPEAHRAVRNLATNLTRDGWQPLDHGDYWWTYRFWRYLNPQPEIPQDESGGSETRDLSRR